MKVLVLGTRDLQFAKKFTTEAQLLAKILVARKHELVASPSNGLEGMVAREYEEQGGENFTCHYASSGKDIKKEKGLVQTPDISIHTDTDSPLRDLIQLKYADVVFSFPGEAEQLRTAITAVHDYGMPFGFYSAGRKSDMDHLFEMRSLNNYEKIVHDRGIQDTFNFLEKAYLISRGMTF